MSIMMIANNVKLLLSISALFMNRTGLLLSASFSSTSALSLLLSDVFESSWAQFGGKIHFNATSTNVHDAISNYNAC